MSIRYSMSNVVGKGLRPLEVDDDTTFYADFDGDLPDGAIFTRATVAYLSDGSQVAANVPRFETIDGRRGLLVEEGTTNLESPDLTGWTTELAIRQKIGEYEHSFTATSPISSGVFLYKTNYPAGIHTFQAEVKGVGSTIGKSIRWRSLSLNFYSEPVILTNEYQKVIGTVEMSGTSAIGISVVEGLEIDEIIFLRNLQVEAKPYPTSFIDDTRYREILTIPTEGVLNPQEGTIQCWVYVNDLIKNTFTNRYVFAVRRTGDSYIYKILLYHTDSNNWRLLIADENTYSLIQIQDNLQTGWHHFAARWSPTEFALFIDGVKVAFSYSPLIIPGFDDTTSIGSLYSSGGYSNTFIDDFRISSRALSDEEIVTSYLAGKQRFSINSPLR